MLIEDTWSICTATFFIFAMGMLSCPGLSADDVGRRHASGKPGRWSSAARVCQR
jgi:hypothetical protein